MKLIDFGTAKEITDRTTTIIGTPHYMACEVIIGEGYTMAVEYWRVGKHSLSYISYFHV